MQEVERHRVLNVSLLLGVLLALLTIGCGPERDINDQLILASRKGDLNKVKELLGKGANVNAREKVTGEGQPALFHAASYGHTEIVKLLIEKGANVNAKPPALTVAAWAGHAETVRVLLEAGAMVNAEDDGHTALTDAVRKDHRQVVQLLLVHGANVNARLPDGNTPLSWAKANKDEEMVKLLKTAGARD